MLRTVTILLAAAFIGLVGGGLTFLCTRSAAGAVLVGLTVVGASVLGLKRRPRHPGVAGTGGCA
ncbi:hypothetical protein [Kitasatospora acidiphila]|uniref:hypothetical protein n=1 Tax=Kitasatospora acidiphila TaxID=2567942 RepID=UPI003C7610E9